MPQLKSSCHIGQGVALRSQTKCVIMNIFKSVWNENLKIVSAELQLRVVNMCIISVCTLRKMLIESNKLRGNETFNTLGKNKTLNKQKVNIEWFQQNTSRNIIYNFYTNYKKLPCIWSLLSLLKINIQILAFISTEER